MRKETSEWSVRMLTDFQERINVEAEYQRGKVWSQAQQALLIDSILRGFDIPKIFLRKLPDGSPYLFDLIDGKQRLTAIWQFLSDAYPLLRTGTSTTGLENLSGKRWSEMPDTAKDRLQFANLTVSKIEDATDDEIRELFLRLQSGEPLNAAEVRNAIAGPVRDFVADHLATHTLWAHTRLRATRFGRDEHSAIVLALVVAGGPTNLKGADLQKLYELDDFDPDGSAATHTLAILDRLAAVASCASGYIRTRWALVDLVLVLIQLEIDSRTVTADRLMRFFEEFETTRREVAVILTDLQTRLVDPTSEDPLGDEDVELRQQISPEMLTYHLAFAREGASKENVTARSTIMYQHLVASLNDRHVANLT